MARFACCALDGGGKGLLIGASVDRPCRRLRRARVGGRSAGLLWAVGRSMAAGKHARLQGDAAGRTLMFANEEHRAGGSVLRVLVFHAVSE
jgi:hypothetical protein